MFSPAMTDHHAPPHLPPPPPPPFVSHLERKWKPHLETAPNCPRCASANTKFCYYNNYSLSQPRYFCKSCRRYWTKGGSLRNVPVGGGCRKTRRSKSSRSSSSAALSRPTNSDLLSTQLAAGESSSSNGSDIDLAAVFARFLNPPPTTSSPESADLLDDLTAENSEIFFEELSDFLLDDENQPQGQKQGITEDYENFPIGLQPELGVDELWPSQQIQQLQESDSFSYNGNHQYYQMGENWVNNVDFF